MTSTNIPKVIDRRKLVEDQTTARRAMLANGYAPLPANEKRCLVKGWPALVVDEAQIETWSHWIDYRTTALRLDGDLVAIDVDVNDPLAEEIVALFDRMVDPEGETLVRHGKGHKVMFLGRVDRPFGVMRSRGMRRTADADDDLQFVEVFSSGTARYFTMYGPHTEGELTSAGVEVLIEYRWGGDSPMTVPRDELPVLSYDALLRFTSAVTDLMLDAGWHPEARSPVGVVETGTVKRLTDDMEFEMQDGTTVSLADLADRRGERCSASWLDGGHNTSRCLVTVTDDGMPRVFDTATFCHYVPVDWRTKAERSDDVTRELGAALQPMLAARPDLAPRDEDTTRKRKTPKRQFGKKPKPSEGVGAAIDYIEDSYAYYPAGASMERIVPLDGTATRGVDAFMVEWAPWCEEGKPKEGQKGRPAKQHPAAIWLSSERRKTLAGFRFAPGDADTLVADEDGELWFNRWQPANFRDAEPEGLEIFQQFLIHLLPKEEERAWFINWLAYKLQHPEARGQGVVLVSVRGNAGRGVLFAIMQGVFGPNCAPVMSNALLGQGGQADYNSWIEYSTVAFCSEFRLTDTSYAAKHQAYERLKELVDTTAGSFKVTEKYERGRNSTSHMALIIATNNLDALPLPPQDRRFTILTATEKPLKAQPFSHKLFGYSSYEGRYAPGFCRAVHDWLMSLDAVADDFRDPLPTEARDEMVSLGEGKVEMLLRRVLQTYERKDLYLREVGDIVDDVTLMAEQTGNDRIKDAVTREVPSLLRRGFAGWHNTQAHKVTVRRADGSTVGPLRVATNGTDAPPSMLSEAKYTELSGVLIA